MSRFAAYAGFFAAYAVIALLVVFGRSEARFATVSDTPGYVSARAGLK